VSCMMVLHFRHLQVRFFSLTLFIFRNAPTQGSTVYTAYSVSQVPIFFLIFLTVRASRIYQIIPRLNHSKRLHYRRRIQLHQVFLDITRVQLKFFQCIDRCLVLAPGETTVEYRVIHGFPGWKILIHQADGCIGT
jgi:hypothetical protein